MKKNVRILINNIIFLFMAVFLCCLVGGCQSKTAINWNHAMRVKISRFQSHSKRALEPYLKKAGLSYPVDQLAILIIKDRKQLELYGKSAAGHWRFIRTYSILAASGRSGPKLHAGDHQVPEGVYKIVGLNPLSHFDLSMHLNYPNDFDRQHAQQDGRGDLGGDIYIHGDKRSIGCIAIGDKAIEQLFPLVYETGIENVQVIIAPSDFRYKAPRYYHGAPRWLPQLYVKILNTIEQFPEPK